jgi:hypothetical protein
MTILEIKQAILAGYTVCWNNSSYIVTLESVCPLHDLSVTCKRTNTSKALKSSDFDNCFIL